ncbi:hypothetical protein ACIHFE_29890 [Streptomyces sp. NPDC052396]|uniref:hypothetical protein n=1 Tax=Streptomyces sp. NPDC052396 TaxID=3365689 RepID=UPI0037D2DE63
MSADAEIELLIRFVSTHLAGHSPATTLRLVDVVDGFPADMLGAHDAGFVADVREAVARITTTSEEHSGYPDCPVPPRTGTDVQLPLAGTRR